MDSFTLDSLARRNARAAAILASNPATAAELATAHAWQGQHAARPVLPRMSEIAAAPMPRAEIAAYVAAVVLSFGLGFVAAVLA